MIQCEINIDTEEKPEASNVFYFGKEDKDFSCEGFSKAGWYFWDETETKLIGPFSSAKKAQIGIDVYNNRLDAYAEKMRKRYYHEGDGIIREIND